MFDLDHFGIIAPIYEKYSNSAIPAEYIDRLGLDGAARILDVGGGTGRIAQAIADPSREVYLIDPSFKMLRFAVRKVGIHSAQSVGEYLPFPSNSFDRVIIVDAFHHVMDQKACIRELLRVIKPGGRLVIVEPDIQRFAVKIIALAEKLLLMRSHIMSGEKIAELVDYVGTSVSVVRNAFNVWVTIYKALV